MPPIADQKPRSSRTPSGLEVLDEEHDRLDVRVQESIASSPVSTHKEARRPTIIAAADQLDIYTSTTT
jgi:hypothetical protein